MVKVPKKTMRKFIWGSVLALSMLGCLSTAASFKNPDKNIKVSDLAGTWEAHYGKGNSDTLTLRDDGTYQQRYEEADTGYLFETPWNRWWMEYLQNGQVRVHLEGGRYYFAGIRIAELEGWGDPCPSELPDCGWGNSPRPFYDPYADDYIEMAGKLVLNVRLDHVGELVLYHMWTSGAEGFVIIGGEREIFRRKKSP